MQKSNVISDDYNKYFNLCDTHATYRKEANQDNQEFQHHFTMSITCQKYCSFEKNTFRKTKTIPDNKH